MKITETQLEEYIALYKKEYGIEVDRARALSQLNKLITLVMFTALPNELIEAIENAE